MLSGLPNSSAGTLHRIQLGAVAVLASFLFLGFALESQSVPAKALERIAQTARPRRLLLLASLGFHPRCPVDLDTALLLDDLVVDGESEPSQPSPLEFSRTDLQINARPLFVASDAASQIPGKG